MSDKKSINARRFMNVGGMLSTIHVLILAICSLMLGCQNDKVSHYNFPDDFQVVKSIEAELFSSETNGVRETKTENVDANSIPDYFDYKRAVEAYEEGRLKASQVSMPHVFTALMVFGETNLVAQAYRDGYEEGLLRNPDMLWDPVKGQTDIIKSRVAHAPRDWSTSYTTSPSWKPQMRYGFDPRSGYVGQVTSQPGTDPGTAAKAYAIYIFTTIQTESLHTSSIGSFSIAATVDVVSFQPCKATINVWMYNEMSRRSFGQFADSWVYRGRALPTQFMWWNWKEKIRFDGKGGYKNEN